MPALAPPRSRCLPVTAHARIRAPRDRVWATIAAPGNLEAAHPYVKANPVERWPGPDARDRIVYDSGLQLIREATAWHDGSDGEYGYDLAVWNRPGAVSRARWRVTEEGPAASRLTITIWPYLLASWPAGVRQLGQALAVRPAMRWYLRSVVLGFRHVVETGEPVQRNQFGWHPMFSARTR
ncbi:MAG: SRPBCC family protein [Rubricoccaceae bacterium]|nr:SRPBCC family protein [Rubricoccaceae bacterium]